MESQTINPGSKLCKNTLHGNNILVLLVLLILLVLLVLLVLIVPLVLLQFSWFFLVRFS